MKKTITLLCVLFVPFLITAQLGTIDQSFVIGSGAGTSLTQKRIETIVQQPDGKLLLGGWFTHFNEIESHRIVRLNPDGSVDNTFNIGEGFNGTSPYVNAIALQPDGKIVVGGNFLSFNGVTRHRIARLNTDGTLDESFNPLTGFNSDVNSVAIQPDGKIVVGGIFSLFDWLNQGGTARQGVARLHSDGTLDTSFDSAIGFTSDVGQTNVRTVIAQPNGKIICAGIFNDYKGISRTLIARLNEDASLDTSFDAGDNFSFMFGSHGAAVKTVLLPNGKIITAGTFRHIGADSKAIVKLNSDGTHDDSLAIDLGNISALTVQSDGKLLVTSAGPFFLKRYFASGAEDTAFPALNFNNWVKDCILQDDGNIVIGGWFSYNPTGLMRVIGDTPNLSLNNIEQNDSIKIYPNPATDNLTIDLSEIQNFTQASLTIVDAQGRKLSNSMISNKTTNLSVDHLPKGFYLFVIDTENSQTVKKIMVQ